MARTTRISNTTVAAIDHVKVMPREENQEEEIVFCFLFSFFKNKKNASQQLDHGLFLYCTN
jgi:hypothetical protein